VSVELAKPTLLIDEADTFLKDNEDLPGNAGDKRGGQVIRCVGDNAEPRVFSVFGPVAMQGIDGGMNAITNLILAKLKKEEEGGKVKCNEKLVGIQPRDEGTACLIFANRRKVHAKHVILALPKASLEEIIAASSEYFPPDVRSDIDSVFGFPMVKVFFIVKRRWWEEDHRANFYATRVPNTRASLLEEQNTGEQEGHGNGLH
jgi:Flavin containing amine oxidoreductase